MKLFLIILLSLNLFGLEKIEAILNIKQESVKTLQKETITLVKDINNLATPQYNSLEFKNLFIQDLQIGGELKLFSSKFYTLS